MEPNSLPVLALPTDAATRDHERPRASRLRLWSPSARGAAMAKQRAPRRPVRVGRTTRSEGRRCGRIAIHGVGLGNRRRLDALYFQPPSNPHGLAARRWPPVLTRGPADARAALRAPRDLAHVTAPPPSCFTWPWLGSVRRINPRSVNRPPARPLCSHHNRRCHGLRASHAPWRWRFNRYGHARTFGHRRDATLWWCACRQPTYRLAGLLGRAPGP